MPALTDSAITMGYGSGGKLTHRLIQQMILPAFTNPVLAALTDAAVFPLGDRQVALTTDSYVVSPRRFPGGDIGRLAVSGTVNDLAAVGARAAALSCGLIIEEGFLTEELERILASMRDTAAEAGVPLVTGDTKVVERGKGDGLFINTSGLGLVDPRAGFSLDRAVPGDKILVTGSIGDHGITILVARDHIVEGADLASDCAPCWPLVEALLDARVALKFARDPTRGGVATVLNEWAGGRPWGIAVHEAAVPVREAVAAVCELLGLDPLFVANEGKLVLVVASEDADRAVAALARHPLGTAAAIIGEVTAQHPGQVVLQTAVGGARLLDMLTGDQLPRIC